MEGLKNKISVHLQTVKVESLYVASKIEEQLSIIFVSNYPKLIQKMNMQLQIAYKQELGNVKKATSEIMQINGMTKFIKEPQTKNHVKMLLERYQSQEKIGEIKQHGNRPLTCCN